MPGSSSEAQEGGSGMLHQQIWSPRHCRDVLEESVLSLKAALDEREDGSVLVWDKVRINKELFNKFSQSI